MLAVDSTPRLKVKRLSVAAVIPAYHSVHAAGLDLSAALEQPLRLEPLQRCQVPTGIAVEIPPGSEGQLRPRSGLALQHGLTLLNSPGTIDADYRGEVKVLLINLGQGAVTINPGDRIAQLVIAPVTRAVVTEVAELTSSVRGEGGFGHTGR
ncbi:MAG TPA: dUTP diphosphatase [Candidatus Binataceae bacterium]|nr:dUTP diphosphatase [Candidatus Binataceae bacterium]